MKGVLWPPWEQEVWQRVAAAKSSLGFNEAISCPPNPERCLASKPSFGEFQKQAAFNGTRGVAVCRSQPLGGLRGQEWWASWGVEVAISWEELLKCSPPSSRVPTVEDESASSSVPGNASKHLGSLKLWRMGARGRMEPPKPLPFIPGHVAGLFPSCPEPASGQWSAGGGDAGHFQA